MVVSKMKIDDLARILEGDITHIDDVDVSDVALYEDSVIIYPNHVKVMLEKYLAGSITSDELNKWARFIVLRGEYDCPDCELSDEDHYEAMWDVIQALSVPEIDGDITHVRVEKYITQLGKYKD